MRVMGVDPGLTRCGVGVVEGQTGRGLRLIDVVVIRTPHGDPLAQRLTALEAAMEELVERHRPDMTTPRRGTGA